MKKFALTCHAASKVVGGEGLWRRLCRRDFGTADATVKLTQIQSEEKQQSATKPKTTASGRNQIRTNTSQKPSLAGQDAPQNKNGRHPWLALYRRQIKCRQKYPGESLQVRNAFLEMEAAFFGSSSTPSQSVVSGMSVATGMSVVSGMCITGDGDVELVSFPAARKKRSKVTIQSELVEPICCTITPEGQKLVAAATGDNNTGDNNTGDNNTGDNNTGDNNTGDNNTGDNNTGDNNTGDNNTGDNNTGDHGGDCDHHDCVKEKCLFESMSGTTGKVYICKSTGLVHVCGDCCDLAVQQIGHDGLGGDSCYVVCPLSGQIIGQRRHIFGQTEDEPPDEEDDCLMCNFSESIYSRRNPLRP
eukprot:CAMPEP_0113849838 /NCGR_PEP_ID=MMETSP0372-20130328/3418_1 /TAXON_ID=340204 /ORGANISM="Lankesteria abbotti" /LENGTH=358 /DNA_ID=CAMNT_0000819803 /DNA_START=89 /DNA_END=1165 /DNA_ORIENTATION=+ /assembly_acc=CAM_ASM_000359